MEWVGVLPWVYAPYHDACVATMAPEFRERVLDIDNQGSRNVGIMRAHNMGVDFMREQGADWLIIISAAVRFGERGGMDFIDTLAEHDDHYIIHAATDNVAGGRQQEDHPGGGINGVFGWHLTAFKREVFDNIGVWDENFTPYGYDDIDLSLRIQKHYKGAPGWNTYPIDVTDTTMAHSLNMGGVKSPGEPKHEYFQRKWGREGGEWQSMGHEHPFDDETKTLDWWPRAGDPLANAEAWAYLEAATQ